MEGCKEDLRQSDRKGFHPSGVGSQPDPTERDYIDGSELDCVGVEDSESCLHYSTSQRHPKSRRSEFQLIAEVKQPRDVERYNHFPNQSPK